MMDTFYYIFDLVTYLNYLLTSLICKLGSHGAPPGPWSTLILILYMYTVIWLVNNDLSEASVKIHSVTGIIESEPSENSYNGNVWEKNQNFFGFLIFIPKTHLMECSSHPTWIVTSLSPLNLNLNSAVFKYNALQYKVKVVIANQFLYQNTTHLNGPSSHPTWIVTLWPNYHLQISI